MDYTRLVVRHVLAVRFQDLPPEAQELARWCFLDWLGCALAGSQEPLGRILAGAVQELGGAPQATVIGHKLRTSTTHAALVNGAASHAQDYDDVHPSMPGHPAASLIPALLAVAEWRGSTGAELLAALVAGYDVQVCVGQAVGTEHYDHGWHATGTIGHLGAAAGAGRLLHLSEEQMVSALGLAGTQAAGLRRSFGTMAKPFHPGKAAADGVLGALLARRGFTGPDAILEGKLGFGQVFSSRFDAEALRAKLAGPPAVLQVAFKRHAACGATHSTIDAVLAMRERGLRAERLAELHLQVYRLAMDAAGKLDPQSGLEAKFSVPFCAALALVHGAADESLFTDAMAKDPEIRTVMSRIRIDVDPSLQYVEAMPVRALARMADGQELREHVELPKGRPSNPFSAQDFRQKFTRLAGTVLPAGSIGEALDLCARLDQLTTLTPLIRVLGNASSRGG